MDIRSQRINGGEAFPDGEIALRGERAEFPRHARIRKAGQCQRRRRPQFAFIAVEQIDERLQEANVQAVRVGSREIDDDLTKRQLDIPNSGQTEQLDRECFGRLRAIGEKQLRPTSTLHGAGLVIEDPLATQIEGLKVRSGRLVDRSNRFRIRLRS